MLLLPPASASIVVNAAMLQAPASQPARQLGRTRFRCFIARWMVGRGASIQQHIPIVTFFFISFATSSGGHHTSAITISSSGIKGSSLKITYQSVQRGPSEVNFSSCDRLINQSGVMRCRNVIFKPEGREERMTDEEECLEADKEGKRDVQGREGELLRATRYAEVVTTIRYRYPYCCYCLLLLLCHGLLGHRYLPLHRPYAVHDLRRGIRLLAAYERLGQGSVVFQLGL
jgi:hypothetical protein